MSFTRLAAAVDYLVEHHGFTSGEAIGFIYGGPTANLELTELAIERDAIARQNLHEDKAYRLQ